MVKINKKDRPILNGIHVFSVPCEKQLLKFTYYRNNREILSIELQLKCSAKILTSIC